jgi:hypothetical protein
MSKAFRSVRKTAQGPHLERFQQRSPSDEGLRNKRLRAIAQRLKGSGQNLADATPNSPHPREG